MMKTLFFVFDGLADFPEDKTPLSEARKPNIDFLANKGIVANLQLFKKSDWNEQTRASVSHLANISLLGYDIKKFPLKRGILEAISAGIEMKNGWLALRCDFATIKDGIIVDRRAGRNIYGLDRLAEALNKIKIGVPFVFKRTYGHRAVLVIKEKLSDNFEANDPLSNNLPPKEFVAKDKQAEISVEIVKRFLEKAVKVLEKHKANKERIIKGVPPANYLLFREPGNKIMALRPSFRSRFHVRSLVISEAGVMKATCMLAGFDAIEIPEGLDYRKGIRFIFEKIEESLPSYDFIYAHIKWTDEAAHDGDFERKKKVIEEFDKYLENYRNFEGRIVITTDHITSCKTRKHEFGNVPVLISPIKSKKKLKTFDEFEAAKGMKLNQKKLWKIVFSEI
jgi:2,3-bisphosphoglycerate-independent phosphoglycerate mutase